MWVTLRLRPLAVRTNPCRRRQRQFKHHATGAGAGTQAKVDARDHSFDSKFNIQNASLTGLSMAAIRRRLAPTGDHTDKAALRGKSATLTLDIFVSTKGSRCWPSKGRHHCFEQIRTKQAGPLVAVIDPRLQSCQREHSMRPRTERSWLAIGDQHPAFRDQRRRSHGADAVTKSMMYPGPRPLRPRAR
jgi:hypothetical protein